MTDKVPRSPRLMDSLRAQFESANRKQNGTWFRSLLARVRDLVLIVFLLVLTWRFAWADMKIDLSDFRFTDLVALVLALFAIGLGVFFYRQADETSHKFYDQMYNFTKDTSQILGRIEAGFGERLKQIHEQYGGLSQRLDQLNPAQVREQIKQEQKEVQDGESKKAQVIEDFAERAKLDEKEKVELLEKFKDADRELADARTRLAQLERGLDQGRTRGVHPVRIFTPADEELAHHVVQYLSIDLALAASPGLFDLFNEADWSGEAITMLRHRGWIEEDGNLTGRGAKSIRDYLERDDRP